MQIFVKTLEGETKVVQISNGQTVLDAKQYIGQTEGIDFNLLDLVCEGSVLRDEDFLTETVKEQATVYVTAGLDGGKKKKKKKPHTTPKKNKHKHKSVKLAVLQCYSVDAAGKISYSRKLCPMPQCPPGSFMAKHYDRWYCGKCHISLKLDPQTIKANLAELEKRQAAKKKEAEGAAAGKAAAKGGKAAPAKKKK